MFEQSRLSSNSTGSSRYFLRLNPIVNPSQATQTHSLVTKGKGKQQQKSKTEWPADQTVELIHFFAAHHASAGDNNFKTVTFNEAAAELNKKYPITGNKVPKTASNCSMKWSSVCTFSIYDIHHFYHSNIQKLKK